MTKYNTADAAIERIMAISWRANDSRVYSHIALLREYLRRAALWAKALESTEKWPFFDVAAQIHPSLHADRAKLEMLGNYLTPLCLFGSIKRTCEWFVHWSVAKNKPEVTKFDLLDPYEPLILMYERGGSFYTEHGFFYVSFASFSKGNWRQYHSLSPVIELDEKALDSLDAEQTKVSFSN